MVMLQFQYFCCYVVNVVGWQSSNYIFSSIFLPSQPNGTNLYILHKDGQLLYSNELYNCSQPATGQSHLLQQVYKSYNFNVNKLLCEGKNRLGFMLAPFSTELSCFLLSFYLQPTMSFSLDHRLFWLGLLWGRLDDLSTYLQTFSG